MKITLTLAILAIVLGFATMLVQGGGPAGYEEGHEGYNRTAHGMYGAHGMHGGRGRERHAEDTTHILSVSGNGVATAPTTLTHVDFGVQARADTAREAQRIVAQATSSVVLSLNKVNGLQRLQTESITLEPVLNYTASPPAVIGFEASNQLSFEISTDNAGEVLDMIVENGATNVRVSLIATDEAIAQANLESLRLATDNAITRANTVLQEVNRCIEDILTINVQATQPPRAPAPVMAFSRGAEATPVISGETDIASTVSMTMRFGRCPGAPEYAATTASTTLPSKK